MIANKLTDLIGKTPMLQLEEPDLQAQLIVKLEYFNPGGSVKDRVALSMIEDAEKQGLLNPGATIIEPTSGNTGVGLAWVGVSRGYHIILTMPDTMSIERRNLLSAYGAEIILTPGTEGMSGSIQKAEEIRKNTPGAVILGQFTNLANPAIHEQTTGEEIWQDMQGDIDVLVAGVGTGGTLSGSAHALHKHNPAIEIIAVEPATSAVLSGEKSGKHGLQGIGAGFIPETCDCASISEITRITDEEAFAAMRHLSRQHGLLVGISSGAAYAAARKKAILPENKGRKIVAILPDTGERYLSTGIFNN